jgi:hypothetical protein
MSTSTYDLKTSIHLVSSVNVNEIARKDADR